jgi:acyl dehydratase
VRIGDSITVKSRLKDAYEKQGGSGSMLFVIFEYEYVNQHGRTAVRVTGTRIRR